MHYFSYVYPIFAFSFLILLAVKIIKNKLTFVWLSLFIMFAVIAYNSNYYLNQIKLETDRLMENIQS